MIPYTHNLGTGLRRREVITSFVRSLLLFTAPFVVLYEFQALGYGAIVRTLIMNAFSPVWWAMVGVFIFACVQLFRFYDYKKRPQVIDAFFRTHALIYALTLGLFTGYLGGSLDRFLDSRDVMVHGNALHAELARQMSVQGHYSAAELHASVAYQNAQAAGLHVQLLGGHENLLDIVSADLTVFVDANEFAVVVPYDLPYLIYGVGSSRIFQRSNEDEFWSKKYLKLHAGYNVEISDKA